MSKKYMMAIDAGTTSSRCIIFNQASEIVSVAKMEFDQILNTLGWVEENPREIWATTYEVISEALNLKGIKLDEISSIGITNQRETTIIWDKKTGEPVYNAIVWQSRQSQEITDEWINKGYKDMVHKKTGLLIDPYFSASKIRWIFDHVPGTYERAKAGELLFGTVDCFIAWKLSEGALHITDVSNASRTMLFNINTLEWDQELLDLFDIPKEILPEVRASSERYGNATALKRIEDVDVPICSLIGDQQAALFGHCCFKEGDVKNTYGTGCFTLMNTKSKPCFSNNGLLTTVAWKIGDEVDYALEGSVFVAGSAIQWLRDGMRIINSAGDCEIYSTREPSSNGVYVVPAFVGLGTPYWDDDARGAVFGMTRGTKKEHFINATVESIAYQSKDVIEVMKTESGIKLQTLAVDGGCSANNYLMQFQADILPAEICRPAVGEVTALGAAYLAGLCSGYWATRDDINKARKIDKIFLPIMKESERQAKYAGWQCAVKATQAFKINKK